MRSFTNNTTPSVYPNAFTATFLGRLAERDEPPTAGDADVAGPWRIEPIPGHGFGLFRVGESLARGFTPVAVFPSRWLALLMAGILPGTGKDPLLLLSKQPDAHGAYPVALAGGGDDGGDGGDDGRRPPVGFFQLFDVKALDALNVVIHLIQAPESLAYVLEAAGWWPSSGAGPSSTSGRPRWSRSSFFIGAPSRRWRPFALGIGTGGGLPRPPPSSILLSDGDILGDAASGMAAPPYDSVVNEHGPASPLLRLGSGSFFLYG